ncbi:hypothetical protein FQN57_004499 [Myotisia sp. PD_48]|nr:hypothetical protein FQN57_004499 [Myotisia sp. PD_48]
MSTYIGSLGRLPSTNATESVSAEPLSIASRGKDYRGRGVCKLMRLLNCVHHDAEFKWWHFVQTQNYTNGRIQLVQKLQQNNTRRLFYRHEDVIHSPEPYMLSTSRPLTCRKAVCLSAPLICFFGSKVPVSQRSPGARFKAFETISKMDSIRNADWAPTTANRAIFALTIRALIYLVVAIQRLFMPQLDADMSLTQILR